MLTPEEELEAVLDRICRAGEATKADRATLRRLFKQYSINIEQVAGGELQIGDRNYYGANAETIGEVLQTVLQSQPKGKRSRQQKSLLTTVKSRISKRLNASLHKNILIELGKTSQLKAVDWEGEMEVIIGSKSSEPLPPNMNILDVFEQSEIGRRLLILGDVGSGKTTTLLKLAGELAERAEKDIDSPIPVVFNLFSWKEDKQSLREWLVLELQERYRGEHPTFAKT